LANGDGTRRDKVPGTKGLTEDGSSRKPSDMTRREAADYIAGMLDGLHTIADTANLPFVAYLLAMAKDEAQAEKARED
jgi:hypothetical protein